MRSVLLAGLLTWSWVCACGGAQHEQAAHEAVPFDCRNRIASYIVAHHMAGDDLGVQVDCAQGGPRIKRWRTDIAGNRQEDSHSLTPGEFDSIWKEIDGTGWPNLRDCTNGTGGKQDPVYTFDIKDDQNQVSFQCQSQAMPYPYNDIVDPLDLAAQNGRRQLGDDEPAEIKAPKAPASSASPASPASPKASKASKAPKAPSSNGAKAKQK